MTKFQYPKIMRDLTPETTGLCHFPHWGTLEFKTANDLKDMRKDWNEQHLCAYATCKRLGVTREEWGFGLNFCEIHAMKNTKTLRMSLPESIT